MSASNKIKFGEKIINFLRNGKILSFFNAKKKAPPDYIPHRKYVAQLIINVITSRLMAREALLRFPPDIKDPSIETAWHALCHRESDEEIRLKEPLYKEEQDEYLEMIAFTLQSGDELPQNIINSYKKYHSEALIPHKKGIKGIWKELLTFLNI